MCLEGIFFVILCLFFSMLFEDKIIEGLRCAGLHVENISSDSPLGIAVSGGADSLSLLVALSKKFSSDALAVITVDHGIRSPEESGGDADFVKDVCKKLCVQCETYSIANGEIAEVAKESGKSIEETARKFRYSAFDSFIEKKNLCALCIAHNLNDQTETLLMRFLNGSGAEGLFGIQNRNKIIRPLLNVERNEIEAYLSENGYEWRTDSTNSENDYLRNRIRNLLVPVLNEKFPFWKKSVLAGAEKSFFDNVHFESLLPDHVYERIGENAVRISEESFFSFDFALRRRLVLKVVNAVGFGSRFPFSLVKKICDSDTQKLKITKGCLSIYRKSGFLYFEKKSGEALDDVLNSGFSYIFSDVTDYAASCQFGILPETLNIDGPFCVRSAEVSDRIQTADGKSKSVSDLFNDWKVPEEKRNKIPVVQVLGQSMTLKAVLGKTFGFTDWIVR